MIKPRVLSGKRKGQWVTLSEWSQDVGVSLQNAKDMAQRGRMGKDCVLGIVEVERYVVKRGTPYPIRATAKKSKKKGA